MRQLLSLVLLALLLLSSTCFSQRISNTHQITVKKKFLGRDYIYNGQKIKYSDLSFSSFKRIMWDYPEGLSKVKSAEFLSITGFCFGIVGGFLLGYPIGVNLAGEKVNWTVGAIGGGMIVIAITLDIISNSLLGKSVELYNESLEQRSDIQPEIRLGLINENPGLKLVMNF